MEIQFKKTRTSRISLNIPMEGISVEEWKLLPMATPCIIQSKVDSLQPGNPPRFRKLTATLSRDCKKKISGCFHLVTLESAIGPNQMRIKLDAFNPVESLDQSVATPHSTDEQRPSNSPCLTIEDVNIVLAETVSASSQWFNLGLALGLDNGKLSDIEQSNQDNEVCLRKMLTACLQKTNLSWASLCSGLEQQLVGRSDVASRIREKYLVGGHSTSPDPH